MRFISRQEKWALARH